MIYPEPLPPTPKHCETCRVPVDADGNRFCSLCWEVQSRLQMYLRRGGATAMRFVTDEVERATMTARARVLANLREEPTP